MKTASQNVQPNIHLRVSASPDELTFEDSVTIYEDIMEGFTNLIQELPMKALNYEKFISDVVGKYPDIETYDFSRGKNTIFKKYLGKNVRMYVNGNSSDVIINIVTTDIKYSKVMWDIYTENAVKDNIIDIFVHSYYMSGNEVETNNKNMKIADVGYISDKYYPYIDTDVMFEQFFTCAENILVVVGEPGLGKSKLSTLAIKYAHDNPHILPHDKIAENPGLDMQYISVAFVKSTDVLANDKFWNTLETIQPDFVIIDDLDYMLTKRDSEVQTGEDMKKNVFLNQFLSYTDGVEKHKSKFIITTNQRFDEIDAALLRKGRLFDILELRRLDRSEALIIWMDNDLKEDEFNELFKSHEISPAILGSEINKRKNDRIEDATKSYLREEGISKIEKAGRSKKIGL